MSAFARLGILALTNAKIRSAKEPLNWAILPGYCCPPEASNDNAVTSEPKNAEDEPNAHRPRIPRRHR